MLITRTGHTRVLQLPPPIQPDHHTQAQQEANTLYTYTSHVSSRDLLNTKIFPTGALILYFSFNTKNVSETGRYQNIAYAVKGLKKMLIRP
jgi:hypothetical protein